MARKVRFTKTKKWLETNGLDREKINEIIGHIAVDHQYTLVMLQIIFVSDNELLDMNKRHLNHDYYTDIITFDLSEHEKELDGELYISIERIKENSVFNKVSVFEEYLRVIFHGALHLVGYKDKTPKEKKSMTAKENHYLNLYRQLRFT